MIIFVAIALLAGLAGVLWLGISYWTATSVAGGAMLLNGLITVRKRL